MPPEKKTKTIRPLKLPPQLARQLPADFSLPEVAVWLLTRDPTAVANIPPEHGLVEVQHEHFRRKYFETEREFRGTLPTEELSSRSGKASQEAVKARMAAKDVYTPARPRDHGEGLQRRSDSLRHAQRIGKAIS